MNVKIHKIINILHMKFSEFYLCFHNSCEKKANVILVKDFCPLKIKKTQFPVGFRLKFCYKIALKFR